MARITSLIKDITPNTPRPWTVKVRVLEKSSPREARASPTKFQKLVLADSAVVIWFYHNFLCINLNSHPNIFYYLTIKWTQGGRVQLTLFNAHIGMFKDRLEVYRHYYISNAVVKEAALGYQFGSTIYQWSLHNTCLVEDANDDEQDEQPPPHAFIHFSELVNLKGSPSTIGLYPTKLSLISFSINMYLSSLLIHFDL